MYTEGNSSVTNVTQLLIFHRYSNSREIFFFWKHEFLFVYFKNSQTNFVIEI
jgi:hypothetical protein